MSPASPPPLVLTFAASDPTGGAGVQADLLTIAAHGCHPLSVVTALTVQDTRGVVSMRAAGSQEVLDQARCVLADMPVHAFKLGVLGSRANVAAVASILAAHPEVPVVLDPVLASGRGDTLADDEVLAALRDELLPRVTVVTPNSLEARRIAGEATLDECARALMQRGSRYVLITGTHEESGAQVVNTLYGRGLRREDAWPRLPGSYHGSGCTLASAIACGLARSLPAEQAVHQAEAFTWRALQAAFRPGHGQFVPQRFPGAAPGQ